MELAATLRRQSVVDVVANTGVDEGHVAAATAQRDVIPHQAPADVTDLSCCPASHVGQSRVSELVAKHARRLKHVPVVGIHEAREPVQQEGLYVVPFGEGNETTSDLFWR